MPTYRLTGRLVAGELYERHAGLADDSRAVSVQLFSERASEPRVVQAIADATRQISPPPPGLMAPMAAGLVKKRVVVIVPTVAGVSLQAALNRLINRELLLQPPVALAVVLELLDALARAGERGAWHGALTPDAVFLDEELGIRVGDFGLGGAAQASPALRKLLWPKSREPYRAPEAGQGQAASEAGDVYAAGALAYELFTLHKPGAGDKPQVSARREPPTPPSRLDRRINPRLDPALLKALEYLPQRRHRSCQEFAAALRGAAAAVGGAAAGSEVRKLAADLLAREADRTLGPPPWAEPFEVDLLGMEPAAADRTEMASLQEVAPGIASPHLDPKYDHTQVESDPKIVQPRSMSQETPQIDPDSVESVESVESDGAGWDKRPDTISTVDDAAAARKGVLRPIRPDSDEGEIDSDAPGRTRPMRIKGKGAPGTKGKGFMPVRAEPPRSEQAPRVSDRLLVDRPHAPAAPRSQSRPYRSPTLVVLLDTLRRRKRLLRWISAAALAVALAAAGGIQWLKQREKAQREADLIALFGPGQDRGPFTEPTDPSRPIPPKEIAGTPEYAPPPVEGAAFLTVLADVPAWVLIDGTRLPRTTPVFKVPVAPGNHLVVVMDGTGATREQDLRFEMGKLQRMDVHLSRRANP